MKRSEPVDNLPLHRAAAELADLVGTLASALPAEDHDWLADPLRHAARSAADRLGVTAQRRRPPAARAQDLAAAEADVHEVQTWVLLAQRHHHLAPAMADDVDRRCEALLDRLADPAHRPAATRRAA